VINRETISSARRSECDRQHDFAFLCGGKLRRPPSNSKAARGSTAAALPTGFVILVFELGRHLFTTALPGPGRIAVT